MLQQRRVVFCPVWYFYCLAICLLGCSKNGSVGIRPQSTQLKDGQLIVSQELGVIRPGQQMILKYVVKNETNGTWEVEGVRKTCTCTITNVDKGLIPVNAYLNVEVAFTAPAEEGNILKQVVLHLTDDSAVSQVVCEVRAKVRNEISTSPPIIQCQTYPGAECSGVVEICNTTDLDWNNLDLLPGEKWLSVELHPIPGVINDKSVRQRWRMTYRIITQQLSIGVHKCQVRITPKGSTASPTYLDVVFEVMPQVAAYPSSLHHRDYQFKYRNRDLGTSEMQRS